MATIIVNPKDLAELNLVQEILKKMKISSKVIEEKSPYSDSFVKKIKKAEKQKGIIINTDDIWGSLGLK